MSKVNQKPKLDLNLKIPDFSIMRITPPAKLEPITMTTLQFDYSTSQYESFTQDILEKIGVKFNQNNGIISSLVSDLTCVSCTACKAISKDTLMEINESNFQRTQKRPQNIQQKTKQEDEVIDEEKKKKFKQIWKNEKKKHIRPSKTKFQVAFKQNHNISQSQWQEKVKNYFA